MRSSSRYAQDLSRYYRLPAVQVSLTLVLSLFLVAIFIIFALRPTIVSIVSLQKTIIESKKTLQQLETKINFLQKASTQLESLKPFLEILNANIPNEGVGYESIVKSIEAISFQTGTILESESISSSLLFSKIASPFSPNKNQSVISMPYTLRVSGSFAGITSFLNKLLAMERLMTIESVTINKQAGSKSTSAPVAINITGNVFYLADKATIDKSIEEKKGKK